VSGNDIPDRTSISAVKKEAVMENSISPSWHFQFWLTRKPPAYQIFLW